MRGFLWGALTMAAATVALFFLKSWKSTHDRLFLFFAIAFVMMGLNWAGLAYVDPNMEMRHTVYLLRLAAFLLIIVGIIDKNRRSKLP